MGSKSASPNPQITASYPVNVQGGTAIGATGNTVTITITTSDPQTVQLALTANSIVTNAAITGNTSPVAADNKSVRDPLPLVCFE